MSSLAGSDDEQEEEELLKLKEEVETMARRILEYRTSLPNQLSYTISTLISSKRPVSPTTLVHEGSKPDDLTPPEPSLSNGLAILADMGFEVMEEPEEIQLLKQKIESNASKIPIVLKRMNECMARIDKLGSSNGTIHPAFKRKIPS